MADIPSIGGRQATPRDYLEKIFQVPFWLEPIDITGGQRLLWSLTAGQVAAVRAVQSAEAQVNEDVEVTGSSARSEGATAGEHRSAPPQAELTRNETPTAVPGLDSRQVDPEPEVLVIEEKEQAFMLGLASCIGRSPRRVKRFVNVYRIIKAACSSEQRARFVIDGGERGSYQAAMTLLGITTGAPSLAPVLFTMLDEKGDSETVDSIVEELKKRCISLDGSFDYARAAAALQHYAEAQSGAPTIGDLRSWRARVARFTFDPACLRH